MSRVHRFDDYYNNTAIYIIIIDFLFFTFLLNYTIYNVNINFQFGIMRYLYTETLTRPPASQAFNIPNPNDNRGFFNLKMTMPNK